MQQEIPTNAARQTVGSKSIGKGHGHLSLATATSINIANGFHCPIDEVVSQELVCDIWHVGEQSSKGEVADIDDPHQHT